jgi:kumamolisin
MALTISEGGGHDTIRNSGGTSASAPLWAGLIGLADQYAGRHVGVLNPAIYRIGHSTLERKAFHDVTVGTNNRRSPGRRSAATRRRPAGTP